MKDVLYKNQLLTDRQRKSVAILESLRNSGPITKARIAHESRVNLVTVGNYLHNFLKNRIIKETGFDESEGGRRPLLYQLNRDEAYFISVGLNMYSIVGLVTNMMVETKYSIQKKRTCIDNNETVIDEMIALLDELMSQSGLPKEKFKGIGIAVPGLIDQTEKTIRWPTLLGQKDVRLYVPIGEKFFNKFQLPVIVENDATSAVFAENWFGIHDDVKNMIYFYSEVGCGIMIDGKVYHGATGCAGELGIAQLSKDNPDMGNTFGFGRGDMEIGIISTLMQTDLHQLSDELKALKDSPDQMELINKIFAIAQNGDAKAIEIIKAAADRFGKKVAFLVNFLNPDVVVIGGGLEQGGALLMESIKAVVKNWTIDEIYQGISIVPAQFGDHASALGVACVVVQRYFMQA